MIRAGLLRAAMAGLCVCLFLVATPKVEAAQPEQLLFKLMFSIWRGSSTGLVQADSGRVDVYVSDSLYASYHVGEGGRLDMAVPFGQTSRWVLTIQDRTVRTFRAEFIDNLLYLTNRDRGGKSVNYYELSDGGYAIEYFQDSLYITNQGDANAPILGQILSGDAVGAAALGFEDQFGAKALCVLTSWSTGPDVAMVTSGGAGSVSGQVSTCVSTWSASSDSDWLTLTSGTTGGNTAFTTSFEATENTGTTDRKGTISYQDDDVPTVFAHATVTQAGAGESTPPEDNFGLPPDPGQSVGGVIVNVGVHPPGQTGDGMNSAIGTGSSFSDNAAAGFSAGQGGSTASLWSGGSVGPAAGGMPGIVFQWVYAGDKAPDEFFLPIGADGTLESGIDWQTFFDINASGVPMFVILRTFPVEFLTALTPGEHTLNYWLVDQDGARSNPRSDKVTIN